MGFEKIKVVLLGSHGVGKSSLLYTYITGEVNISLDATISPSFMSKSLVIKDVNARLEIWDTAGQEKFNTFSRMYCRGARAILLVYDVSEDDALYKLQFWFNLLQNESLDKYAKIFIIANKIDKFESIYSIPNEIKRFAANIDAKIFETSAKYNIGVSELFYGIAETIIRLNIENPQTTSLSMSQADHSSLIDK